MESVYDQYEMVIGLEAHVQLSTRSKAFCADDARFGGAPNTHISAISLAHPGTLPRLNRAQVSGAIKLGIALGCSLNRSSTFDRKNYFYADLPKGYQITQDRQPICVGGMLDNIRIHHIHMEEDAGKSIHDQLPDASLIDLNRAGVPLLEIVTEPDFRSAEEVDLFMHHLRRLVRHLGISDGNMEQGSLRCDINVSVRRKGATVLGTRCEIKNVNSMRFARRAIQYEVKRQIDLLEAGEEIQQNTLHFDPDTGVTAPLRSKEDAHDYRYFPEPDLPPVLLSDTWLAALKAEMPRLPEQIIVQLRDEYGLSDYDAGLLAEEKAVADYFFDFCRHTPHHKAAANLLINKLLPWSNEAKQALLDFPVTMGQLAGMLELIALGQVSHTIAYQRLLPAMMEQPKETAAALAGILNLIQSDDSDFLSGLIDEVLAAYPDKVNDYRKGKKGLQGFFMGEVMKRSQGKADPKASSALLVKKLDTL
jgi:aspartyl-tRNA(Asn)/glutamyl-tRNA(Gln) amidotransferase subunit B